MEKSWTALAPACRANRITLLRDADHDGVAETRTVFLENLNSPFGMALVGNDLYVADSDKLLRFPISRVKPRSPPRHQGGGFTQWPLEPPLDQKRGGQPGQEASCTSASAPTATSAKTAWKPNRAAPPSGKSTAPAANTAFCLRPAKPQRHGVGTTERRAVDGGQRAR